MVANVFTIRGNASNGLVCTSVLSKSVPSSCTFSFATVRAFWRQGRSNLSSLRLNTILHTIASLHCSNITSFRVHVLFPDQSRIWTPIRERKDWEREMKYPLFKHTFPIFTFRALHGLSIDYKVFGGNYSQILMVRRPPACLGWSSQ